MIQVKVERVQRGGRVLRMALLERVKAPAALKAERLLALLAIVSVTLKNNHNQVGVKLLYAGFATCSGRHPPPWHQRYVFWSGPPAPKATCSGRDPRHQRCWGPIAKIHLASGHMCAILISLCVIGWPPLRRTQAPRACRARVQVQVTPAPRACRARVQVQVDGVRSRGRVQRMRV